MMLRRHVFIRVEYVFAYLGKFFILQRNIVVLDTRGMKGGREQRRQGNPSQKVLRLYLVNKAFRFLRSAYVFFTDADLHRLPKKASLWKQNPLLLHLKDWGTTHWHGLFSIAPSSRTKFVLLQECAVLNSRCAKGPKVAHVSQTHLINRSVCR